MDHMKFETPDLTAQNIDKLAALFPGCVTEGPDGKGGVKKAVNFELLRQMLSGEVLEGDECYEFTWVGKKASIVEANKPIRKTLRPCPEESKNWDTTENLYIEGDNLEVLKLLQEAYLGKVKMIYIDPPYNTGHDFIYNDRFEMDKQEYDQQIGLFDEDGNKQFAENSESNPRFHSDWCSMMYPRLMLARNMLADDGVIFISIDDNECANLLQMCREVFGESNFVADISWQRTYSPRNDSKGVVSEVEHIIAYSKQSMWTPNPLPRTQEMDSIYKNPDNDVRPWASDNPFAPGAATHQGMVYAIQNPFNGELIYPTNGRCWTFSQEQMLEIMSEWCDYELRDLHDEARRAAVCGVSTESVRPKVKAIVLSHSLDESSQMARKVYNRGQWPKFYFTKEGYGGIRRKTYIDKVGGRLPTNLWPYEEVGHTDEAKKELKSLFDGSAPFDTPKPVRLLDRMLTIATNQDSIVMDFFSGSATTADALMRFNLNTGKNCSFILIQLPEKCDADSQAYADGYGTICDLGQKRIQLAGNEIKTKIGGDCVDVGFRVFKVDSSNMNDVFYDPTATKKEILDYAAENIKSDRTGQDLLIQVMLELGIELSADIQEEKIAGKTVFTVDGNYLIACFDSDVDDGLVTEIAKRQPRYAVFRDSSMSSDSVAINFGEIFKTFSPNTQTKVL